ncbi:hypothetical protein KW797_00450 [Candidatus Parcubacteria bacterium]|nr:hypothetical protein [Candidatus Parcubacteria bacterium]
MQSAASIDIFVTNRMITFLQALERRDTVASSLYTPKTWNPGEGDRMEFSIGALSAVAGTVGERQRIPVVDRAQSATLLKKQLQYGQAFEITKRMRKFNKVTDADSEANEAAKGILDGWDYDLTHAFFSKAGSATYSHRSEGTISIACIDTLAPASASHTVTGTGSTTYSNLVGGSGGLQLTTDNLVTAKQLGNQSGVDEYGTPIKAKYNRLVIAQNEDMERKVFQIHGSAKEPEVFENASNFYFNNGQSVTVLTHGDTDESLAYASSLRFRWIAVADALKRLNQMSMAQEPDMSLESIDENNLAARVVGDMFGAYAICGWQDKMYSTTTSAP